MTKLQDISCTISRQDTDSGRRADITFHRLYGDSDSYTLTVERRDAHDNCYIEISTTADFALPADFAAITADAIRSAVLFCAGE